MGGLKVGSINVSSLVRLGRVLEVVKLMEETDLDVILVQEARITDTNSRVIFSQTTDKIKWVFNERGVGTLIFYKAHFDCQKIETDNSFKINAVGIKIKGGENKGLLVLSIYIPCHISSTKINTDLEKLKILTSGCSSIIGGDLNMTNNRVGVNRFLNNNYDNFRLIEPGGPTFLRSGNKLDYFITSNDIFSSDKCQTKETQFDHCLIYGKFNLNFHAVPPIEGFKFKFRSMKWDKFTERAGLYLETRVPEDRNLGNEDIDTYVDSWSDDVNKAINNLVPKGRVGRARPMNINPLISFYIKEKRRLKKRLQKLRGRWYKDLDSINMIKSNIEKAEKKIEEYVRESNRESLNKQILDINSNRNKFRVINRLMGKNKKGGKIRLKWNESEITDKGQKLRLISEFYRDLYKKRTPNCSQIMEVELDARSLVVQNRLVVFSSTDKAGSPVSQEFVKYLDIAKIIKRLSNKHSVGPDNIPNSVIRKLPLNFIYELTKIINHCINNEYFPKSWRRANIILIPKKGGAIECKDLRPISLTSNVGKVFEQVILDRLKGELNEWCVPDFQFGFKEGHSTVDALSVIAGRLQEDRAKGDFTVLCSLDIKKAFDSVWMDGCVFKLKRAGAGKTTRKLVKSFLEGRVAKLLIEGTVSQDIAIERGVPQGSRLGPLLYNIYAGDVVGQPKRREVISQYADDTLIGSSGPRVRWAIKRVNKKLEEIKKNLEEWGIETNDTKTKGFLSRPRKKKIKNRKQLRLKMGGENIEINDKLKYLGVTLDGKGNFNDQNKLALNKGKGLIAASSWLLRNKLLGLKEKLYIYNSIIRAGYTYGAEVWVKTSKHWDALEVVERRAYRLIAGLGYNYITKKMVSNRKVYSLINNKQDMGDVLVKKWFGQERRMRAHKCKLVRDSLICGGELF